MKTAKLTFLFLLLVAVGTGFRVFGLTQSELNTTLGQLELRSNVLAEKVRLAELKPMEWDKRSLLEEWAIVNGETLQTQRDLALLKPATCTYTYSAWSPSACPSSGTQTRTFTATPNGCTGTPLLSQQCTYTPSVCNYTYSAFGTCQPNNTQTRTVTASTPTGCTGTPSLSQSCTYTPPACTYTYSAWSPSTCPASGAQTRTVTASTPTGCTGTPVLSQSCTYVSPDSSRRDVDPSLAVPITGGGTADLCSNLTGVQATVPPGLTRNADGTCTQRVIDNGGQGTTPDAGNQQRTGDSGAGDTTGAQGTNSGSFGDTTGQSDDSGLQTNAGLTVPGVLTRVSGQLNSIIPFLIGLTVVLIIWKLFTYITEAANEEKRAEAKRFIVWGIVGVFCMLSLWGFVNLLLHSFTLQLEIRPGDIPTVPTVNPL